MTTTQKAAAGAAALGTAAILLTSTGGPQSLPLVTDLSSVTLGPALTYDWSDGAGGDVSYGAGALGVSEDGDYLYIACNAANSRRGIAKFRIPQNGGRMTVAEPCSGPTEADIQKVVPGWGAGQALIGGVVEVGGRVCVAVFGSYDANGAAVASHFCGPNLRSLTGPFGGTVAPGLVMGDMGVIPAEWRAELGGSAFSMSKYTSIISRQSVGAAFTAFDPAQVTANGFPMRMLLGCPYPVPKCQTWTAWGPSSDGIEGAEQSGGGFILPGTRTFVAIEREATGWPAPGTTGPNMEGYGYRTDDPALHGTPYPSPEGVRWIYAPSDPAGIKGNKGTRYRLVAKLYDVARFGHEKPEDIGQYATLDLPGPALAQAGAYNAVRGEFYLAAGAGGGVNTIAVLRGWGASGPPPPPVDQDCAGDWSAWTRVAGSESACASVNGSGQRTFTETRTFTVTTPASGNGAACPASPETQTGSEACQMPPAPITCTVTGRPAPYANGDIRRTIRCNTKDPNALPVGTVLRP
jgi:hypothetical protein